MRDTQTVPTEILIHPEHGPLPARRVLDCIFALLPEGRILHRHIDDLAGEEPHAAPSRDADSQVQPVRYVLGDRPPSPAHARCRIIPPRVREF